MLCFRVLGLVFRVLVGFVVAGLWVFGLVASGLSVCCALLGVDCYC